VTDETMTDSRGLFVRVTCIVNVIMTNEMK